MNENLNLCEILKDFPEGTKLYSPLAGVVELKNIDYSAEYPIDVVYNNGSSVLSFTKEGLYYSDATDGECMLWPSKKNRDWSKFKAKSTKFTPRTLCPFDKVLVKSGAFPWRCDIFSYYIENKRITCYCTTNDYIYDKCIPYNEETKHLVGTTKEAPGFYRYWED